MREKVSLESHYPKQRPDDLSSPDTPLCILGWLNHDQPHRSLLPWKIPSKTKSTFTTLLKGILTFLSKSIFKDYLVHDLAAQNTAPPKKFFTRAIEFFVNHNPTTTMTFHDTLQYKYFNESIYLQQFLYQIKSLRKK